MARKCVSCGRPSSTTRFEGKTLTIDHAGVTVKVEGLSEAGAAMLAVMWSLMPIARGVMRQRATNWYFANGLGRAKRSGARRRPYL